MNATVICVLFNFDNSESMLKMPLFVMNRHLIPLRDKQLHNLKTLLCSINQYGCIIAENQVFFKESYIKCCFSHFTRP